MSSAMAMSSTSASMFEKGALRLVGCGAGTSCGDLDATNWIGGPLPVRNKPGSLIVDSAVNVISLPNIFSCVL